MISDETLAAVQSLYDDVEDGYNQRIRQHVQRQMLAHLDEITTELEAIHESCGTGTVRLHDYIQTIEETCTAIRQLAERLDQDFMLFVMGSGKNGKSTLINAFAGGEIRRRQRIPCRRRGKSMYSMTNPMRRVRLRSRTGPKRG